MLMESWQAALERLEQEELIPIRVRQAPVQEVKQGREWVDIERIDDRTPEGRRQLRVALFNNMLIEAEPVVNKFFADLESRGQYPTHEERLAFAKWVENHNLFPHQRQSWEKALRALYPQYLGTEEQALRELDRDDSITSAMMKKHLGTANPRLTVASQNVTRGK
jgi:hypothetical protein